MKVLLEAPILTQSGYGEHSRLVFEALKKIEGTELYINPLNWGSTSWASSISAQTSSEVQFGINQLAKAIQQSEASGQNLSFDIQIHVGIPSEFEKKAPYSVCVTAGIETDRVSPEWIVRTHKGIDKLIVPSEHARLGFTQTSYQVVNNQTGEEAILECNSPVEVVPYPVKEIESVNLDFETSTEFNFLSVALLGPRKNIENMIKWFVDEFRTDNVGLVLKTGQAKGSPMDREVTLNHLRKVLQNCGDRQCKVYLLHGDLEESEIHSLYLRDDIHAYASAAHGEGFGLPIFEAAYSGLPIVATDWSAHTEFLTAPYKESGKVKDKKLFAKVKYKTGPIPKSVVWKDILVEGSNWAYPEEQSFKEQLRKVYKNHGMYQKWANTLKDHVQASYKTEQILDKMAEALIPSNIRPDTDWLDALSEIEVL